MNYLIIKILKLSLLAFLSLSFSFNAMAYEERHIHLNGEHLSPENVLLLDQIAGNVVDDGYYWLNTQTGQWGYEGNNQVQGVLASIANQNQSQSPQDYSSQEYNSQNNDYNESADRYNSWEGNSSTGSVTSGRINGKNCTYVTVSGMTMKSCE